MKKSLTKTARGLRNNATEAEKHLWYMLCLKNLGVKFRRQALIGRYIGDFVCFEKRLVIEIDGGQHADSENDKIRDRWLRAEGFEVLRFWNHDMLRNRDGVLEKITERLNTPTLTLPTGGRESMLPKLSGSIKDKKI
ncbi:MAG: endonuclease domain-containing protein [Candidatus Omnitrophica bacterium]|nr:endonuclease domain-containing protein [Candidatus Omnitrophota bacterium]